MEIKEKNEETKIVVKHLTKQFYCFDKSYKIIPWLFTKKGYQRIKPALLDVSFEIKSGEVVGVIGKNGAGKSTLMKILAGITFPTSGEVMVNGTVGSLINLNAGFEPDFTGRRNIYYKGMLLGMSKEQIDDVIDDIIEFADLGEYFDMPIRTYSSGMSARLGYALAIFSNPDVLITDEVFAVGDRVFREKSRQKTLEFFRAGKTVIFSSHSDGLIKSFCNRVIYVKDNKIAFDGDVEEGLAMYSRDIGFEKSDNMD